MVDDSTNSETHFMVRELQNVYIYVNALKKTFDENLNSYCMTLKVRSLSMFQIKAL